MWAENIRNISDYLEKEIEAQILYLPTYRRIEQDLKALFPNVDEDNLFPEENINDLKSHEHGYIELIQFGMEDVQKKLNLVSEVLKERARTELNSLAGSYLRDVIRGEATVYDKKVLSNLNNEDVNKMFARVEENTLNEVDKQKLRNVIEKLKSKQIKLSEQESYLAHFFSKLVDIHHAQQKKEEPIRQFIEICNKYLEGKRFIYDEVNYAIIMKMKDDKNIELRNLSSGEKQIVSLFSQIYLGEPKSYYVIIDEPELSLSVEWQKTLLPDIINSGRCKFLAAVTHSPFIFANQLDSVTRDMSECISTYHGSR